MSRPHPAGPRPAAEHRLIERRRPRDRWGRSRTLTERPSANWIVSRRPPPAPSGRGDIRTRGTARTPCRSGVEVPQPELQGEPEPGRIGPDPGHRHHRLLGPGQDRRHRRHPRHHVGAGPGQLAGTHDDPPREERHRRRGRVQDQPGVDLDPRLGNISSRPSTDKGQRPRRRQGLHGQPQVPQGAPTQAAALAPFTAALDQDRLVRGQVLGDEGVHVQVGDLAAVGELHPKAQ